MKKLILGLALAFAANAAMAAWSGSGSGTKESPWLVGSPNAADLKAYFENGTLCLEGSGAMEDYSSIMNTPWYSLKSLFSIGSDDIPIKKITGWEVTAIGSYAFAELAQLTKVELPSVTSIGMFAFSRCTSLASLMVSWKMQPMWLDNRKDYGIGEYVHPYVTFVAPHHEELEEMTWEVGYVAKVDGVALSEEEYLGYCNQSVVTPKEKPELQLVQEGEVAVKQTELQAAKAEAVTVADGVVSLGVAVNTNGNFTAETKDWKPVELKSENVEVKDGKIVISIPVGDKSGFMILQSGDAKVQADELKLSGGNVFTGDY